MEQPERTGFSEGPQAGFSALLASQGACIVYPGKGSDDTVRHVLNRIPARRTIAIFGVPRGGTTLVAGLVRRCGIDIGDNLPVNLEDPVFTRNQPEELKAEIEKRNASRDVWGWKFPRAGVYLPKIQDKLRNPRYIVVWRDLLANARRINKRGSPIVEALQHAHRIQAQNIAFLESTPHPALLISYEKAVLDPIQATAELSLFVGGTMPADIDELVRFARPGEYKPV